MSAIAGILYFNGAPFVPGQIEALTGGMQNRGPDAVGHWAKASVALGHCMLRTTPEALLETQPLQNDDGNLVLVFDGRLDNRDELKHEFSLQRVPLRSPSDAEYVLAAYQIWGEGCPKRLLGDFAFAVWDARNQKLFCAVDHIGSRPFYYARSSCGFAFASEEEVLTTLPWVSSKPNEALVLHLLVPEYRSEDNQRFWLQDVWGLRPGEVVVARTSGMLAFSRYWRLEPGNGQLYRSDADCREAFLGLFSEAVRCRMRTQGPIAAMISGGLDSASIAAMAKQLLKTMPGKQFHTYSAIFDDPENCIESHCIQSITKDLRGNAHFVSVPSFQGMVNVQDLLKTVWSRPHPCDNSIPLTAMMCLAASRDGNRVLMHGGSGDVTMWAPTRYPACLMQEGKWGMAWRECLKAKRNNVYLYGTPPLLLFLLCAWTARMPSTVRTRIRGVLHRLQGSNGMTRQVANDLFLQEMQLKDRLHTQAVAAYGDCQQRGQQLLHAQAINSATGLALGLTGYERVAGRVGVELRDPWADKRIVEFFVNLPLEYKVRDGWTKYLVRTSFGHCLGHEVLWRISKKQLGWCFVERTMDESLDFARESMMRGSDAANRFVDIEALRSAYLDYETKASKRYDEKVFFYNTLVLLAWVNRCLG